MAITIKRVKNERGVALHTLKVGDTFLYDNRVGVIASRNGHDFPMELATCREFAKSRPAREWMPHNQSDMLAGSEIVLPVEIEMTYKVVG
jgi:hypothetical protein